MKRRDQYESGADYGYYSDDPLPLEEPRTSPLGKVIGAISIFIAACFFVNTTLAANISLSAGSAVEFGQGIQQTTACSGSTALKIVPASSFSNSSGGGAYSLASIKVTNIPDSCFGSDFLLNAYSETSNVPLALFNSTSTDAVIFNNSGTFQAGAGSTGMNVTSGSGQFTATFSMPVALTSSISKITIQSTPHTNVACSLGGSCAVGDTGPGGGKIFYVSVGGFSCGVTRAATCHYLELAPANWNGGADPTRSWAQTTPIDYTSTNLILSAAIGYGALNTKAIIDQGNSNAASSAASLAASYSPFVNGTTINDWFLPSESEWVEVWTQRAVIPGAPTGGNYWSSTAVNNTNGRYFIFSGTGVGGVAGIAKGTVSGMYVRPARAF